MRTVDRQRARERRTHQLGESDEHYIERVKTELEAATGLSVVITRHSIATLPLYEIRGFTLRGLELKEPLIRVVRQKLAAAATAFDYAAEKLRGAKR